MNKEEIEFIKGYEDLLNKGYCDCNEMNCLGYDSPKEILRIVKQLQQENKQLKDNWDKLREWIVYHKHNENTEEHYLVVDYGTLLGKMQEIEGDNNE